MTDPRAEAEAALMAAVDALPGRNCGHRADRVAAVRAAYRAGIVAELRAVADNSGYRIGCVCHSCVPLRARISELEASG